MVTVINSKYKRALKNASCYEEWLEAARQYDQHKGLDQWRAVDETRQYDYASVRHRLNRMRRLRKQGNIKGLLYNLNEGIHGNAAGMGKAGLYGYALSGTKYLIEEYIDEIVSALDLIDSDDSGEISVEQKRDFFARASHCFGRTALMLSASGSLFFFHLGVARVLHQENILPNVISGSSGGSIAGGLLSTFTDDELDGVLTPDYFLEKFPNEEDRVRKDGNRGAMLQELLNRAIPDLTFRQALEKTGRAMNISIAPAEQHQTSRLLNVLTSPDVLIHSGIRASCAVPGFFPPVKLQALDSEGRRKGYLSQREWVDGAVSDDLPAKRLARLFGVNHSVVSQTNPLVIPFIKDGQHKGSALGLLREGVQRAGREWFNTCSAIVDKSPIAPLAMSRMNSAARAMVNQEYVGDINILAQYKVVNPFGLLDSPSEKQVRRLFDLGERSAWPKIEMIRQQSKISRALDELVTRYGTKTSESTHAWDAQIQKAS